MSITRKYTTERECARLWINESFDNTPDWYFTEWPDFCERFSFCEVTDNYGFDEEETYQYSEPPMWSTWFVPNDWLDQKWIEDNEEEIANLGFTIIKLDEEIFALGINAAGFDFYEAYWIPLYRLRGFEWHDEPEEA